MNLKKSSQNMTLAEALLLRQELKAKRDALQQRINNNLWIRTDAKLSDAPHHLIREAFAVNREIYELRNRIEATNAVSQTINGRKMLNVLSDRKEFIQQKRIIQEAIQKIHEEYKSYKNDSSWTHAISMNDLQKHLDEITAQLHQSNLEIQASNWEIDLI